MVSELKAAAAEISYELGYTDDIHKKSEPRAARELKAVSTSSRRGKRRS